MTNSVRLYVPSKSAQKRISKSLRKQCLQAVLQEFCAFFGGATKYEAIGFWQNGKNELVKEKVDVVQAYYSDKANAEDFILEVAKELRRLLHQDAIAFEINNNFTLLEEKQC